MKDKAIHEKAVKEIPKSKAFTHGSIGVRYLKSNSRLQSLYVKKKPLRKALD